MTSSRRHHSASDVEAKLRQADEMAARGSTQKEISEALGISIMTYHRWRRSRAERTSGPDKSSVAKATVPIASCDEQLAALELENERLRRLVTDLLLEKIALQEQVAELQSAQRQGGA